MLESDIPFNKKIEKIIFEKGFEANQISERFFQDFMEEYASGQSYVEQLYVNEALPLYMKFFNEGRENGCIDPSTSEEAILFYLQIYREDMQGKALATQIHPISH